MATHHIVVIYCFKSGEKYVLGHPEQKFLTVMEWFTSEKFVFVLSEPGIQLQTVLIRDVKLFWIIDRIPEAIIHLVASVRPFVCGCSPV